MKIKDAVNMILWKYGERKFEFTLIIRDRFLSEATIPFESIERVDNNYIYLTDDTVIPLHRVLRIKRGNVTIWSRY